MLIRTMVDSQESLSDLMQLPIMLSVVIIISLAMIGFAVKKLIHLMIR